MPPLSMEPSSWDALIYGSPLDAPKNGSATSDTVSEAGSSWGGAGSEPAASSSCAAAAATSALPAYYAPTEDAKRLPDLPLSLQLSILQFLNVESLASMRQVDRAHRDLLSSSRQQEDQQQQQEETLNAVWKPACQRQWKWISDKAQLQDSAAADESADYARLLNLACDSKSHALDESLFAASKEQQRSSRRGAARRRRPRHHEAPPPLQFADATKTAVRFTGVTGTGDRCVRANAPLPRPVAPLLVKNKKKQHHLLRRCCQKLLRRSKNNKPPVPQWKPFVAPYAVPGSSSSSNTDETTTTYNLTPRLVSYYEVTVLANDQPLEESTSSSSNDSAACVAIGLALSNFRFHRCMPGWDSTSFGYHGDDGCFYHGAGNPRRDVLPTTADGGAEGGSMPTFGVGDCVGCGLDYLQRSIFFCKNGQFLGYIPVTDAQLAQDWYPVVGVDSHCPVRCNFGTATPFQFDLTGYLVRPQQKAVQRALRV